LKSRNPEIGGNLKIQKFMQNKQSRNSEIHENLQIQEFETPENQKSQKSRNS